ncbi:glutathione S-transferase family protein [Shewanella psychrotolerans]|uniref:glutathione S-transferase family protein n=1 Tax=Shewanella psychrotolerans TaxID=2864206 RepID=UPI001C6611C8|nr:glutathione S-transferase family protein [Shewanella psychrotolerans]QYK00001.1 glutathione S-transferase family protein [Shewanella psychrotolerans]
MGLLQGGKWVDKWYDTDGSEGKFVREDAIFRHWISRPSEVTPAPKFAAQSGRYHLYVSLACPWAHRTLIFRELKSLQAHIGVTVVEPHMLSNGWEFSGPNQSDDAFHVNGAETDRLNGQDYLYQIYQQAKPDYSGRVTVPVLWDKQLNTIVSNESSEIIRMFNSEFNEITGNVTDFYPLALRSEIDELNEWIYENINNGVYRVGFATTQQAYEEAFEILFAALDRLEQLLSTKRYLTGDQLTEADWRLFTTLIRFDAVYVGHFKTNRNRIVDMPAIYGYMKELYQYPGVAETVNFEHIKQHYYYSHGQINPTRVVPVGPTMDLCSPHRRDVLKS